MERVTLPVERDTAAGEGWILPESPEMPLLCVRKKLEGIGYEAIFVVELSGVILHGGHPGTTGGAALSPGAEISPGLRALLEGMGLGHSLRFVYRNSWRRNEQRSFAWKIFGEACGESRQSAIDGARRLHGELEVFLGTVASVYRFEPVLTPEGFAEASGRLQGTVLPGGIAVSDGRQNSIGFAGPEQGRGATVIVPHPAKRHGGCFDAAVLGAAGCRFPAQVVVSVRRVALATRESRVVAAALERLRAEKLGHARYHPAGSQGAVEDPEILDAVRQTLESWLMCGAGFRVECWVLSDHEAPAAWLAMLGRELYHDRPVVLGTEAPEAPSAVEGSGRADACFTLDLRNCFPLTSPPPPLFPSGDKLEGAGVKRCYERAPLRLPEQGLLLGRHSDGWTACDVRIPHADRSRHCYIIGSTGTGKSTLLHNMIVQDIEQDRGVCVIDPHGDLYRQVLEAVPGRRIKDLVLINPCDFEHPVGINFLECDGPHRQIQMNFLANEMIKIFDRLYDLSRTGGPIFEQYMRNALLLVLDSERVGATLLDVVQVFEDDEFREFLKSKCRNDLVKRFWDLQAERATGDASLRSLMPYVTSKLNQFMTNELLRPIIGQIRSTVDFRQAMDRGPIVLVNLAKGLLSELDMQLLGMLIIGKIFSAAMGRASLSERQRRPMYLYVDEFQNFTTDTVAYLLAEARKYGLFLTLANQSLGQLARLAGGRSILDAVLGNVGTMLVFRLGPLDAELMQTYCQPSLSARDLQELPDYHVAARLLIHNTPARPFVFQTLQRSPRAHPGAVRRAIRLSRKKHTRTRTDVELAIAVRRQFWMKSVDESA
jgi:hypothetical protein